MSKHFSLYRLVLLAAACGTLCTCSSKEVIDRKGLTSTQHYDVAKGLLDKEDYLRAINEFKIVLRRYPDSQVGDQTLFGLAQAYYFNKDYTDAVYELRRFMRDYPKSPLMEDAQYYLSLCFLKQSRIAVLDQEETKLAIDELKNYLNEYPQGKYRDDVKKAIGTCREKLAEKNFKNARLYFRLKDYQAAVIYCQSVIDKFPDTSWKQPAIELLGLCDIKLKEMP